MFRRLLVVPVLCGGLLQAVEDPLAVPEEVKSFARKATGLHMGSKAKLQALLDATFRPVEQGGLGMAYDNSYTRTAAEVWRDRKANCLSLTAFYVAACQAIEIKAHFAEALNTNRWRRVGTVVRLERHLVALVQLGTEELVADFLPQLRRRTGFYRVAVVEPTRVKALFFANRAVEEMDGGEVQAALATANTAIATDPALSIGWNIHGVVLRALGDDEKAEASFRKSLACDGRDSSSIGNMESLMRAQGRMEEAMRFRVLGQEVRKRDPYFNAFLADEALNEGKPEEALRHIRKAIKLLAYESEFYLTQARIHIALGKTKEAVEDLQLAQKWAVPGERERFDSKLEALKKADQETPRNPEKQGEK